MTRALLVLLLCSGCAMQFDLTAQGDAAPALAPTVVVTDAARAGAVSEAARNWQDGTVDGAAVAAPEVVLADECPEGAWCVTFAPQAQISATCGAEALGCTLTSDTMRVAGVLRVKLPVRKRILISDSVSQYEVVSTIMHEFGHAFGLGHAPDGLMNPHRSDSERKNPRIDAATLAAFEAIAEQ